MAKADKFSGRGFNQDLIVEGRYSFAATDIFDRFGHRVKVHKGGVQVFGKCPVLNAGLDMLDLWGLSQDLNYLTTNTANTISSSNAGDTQEVRIEGYTISGGEFTKVIQTVTLNGQNKVTLDTPLARCPFMENNDAVDFVGDIYLYEDTAIVSGVPSDLSKVQNAIIQDQNTALNHLYNRSTSSFLTTAKNEYFILTEIWGSGSRLANNHSDFRVQIRGAGGVFKTKDERYVGRSTPPIVRYDPYILVPPNSDVKITVTGTPEGLDFMAGYTGVKAEIV
jgi:hypothetical protein